MEITIIINPNDLLAVAVLMADKTDPRVYMQGVHVDIKDKMVTLVATNSKCLAALNIGICDEQNINFIIPADMIKQVKRENKKCTNTVILTYNTESKMIKLQQMHITMNYKAIDGFFLAWRQIIPESFTPAFNFYSLKFLADFQKIAVLLKSKTPIFYHNGTEFEGGVVVFEREKPNDSFKLIGLISPIKIHNLKDEINVSNLIKL